MDKTKNLCIIIREKIITGRSYVLIMTTNKSFQGHNIHITFIALRLKTQSDQ